MAGSKDPFRPGTRVRAEGETSRLGQVCLRDARTVTLLADDGVVVRHIRDRVFLSDEPLPVGVRPLAPPTRGARVSVEAGGGLHPGIVDLVADSGACAVACDDGLIRHGHAALLQSCPLPPPPRHGRGARVAWTERGRACHGTVVASGLTRVKVRRDGGRQEVSGPQGAFRASPVAAALDPAGAADAWSVTRFRRGTGGDLAFEASVRRGGKTTLAVRKAAGSPCQVLPARGAPPGERERFLADTAAWAKSAGRTLGDPAGAWVAWRARLAPYGVLASEHLSCKDGVPSPVDDEDGASHPWAPSP